jgi:hypothetical protein
MTCPACRKFIACLGGTSALRCSGNRDRFLDRLHSDFPSRVLDDRYVQALSLLPVEGDTGDVSSLPDIGYPSSATGISCS